jgi:DNA-binding GntR family transcriptional regulator
MATRERPASAVDRVTAALREAILDGQLAAGARLVEQRLVDEHGAARHTIRAALRALAGEGLVVLDPHRGARVARLDEPAVLALYQLRTALEVEAARLALHRHGGRLPAAVHAAAEELAVACRAPGARWADVTALHGALHHAIVAAARSPRLEQAHAALENETRLFLLQIRPAWPLGRLADDHLALVAGLEAEGPDVLRAHLRASAAELVDAADLA